jgi:type IV pilus assembly protein PilW
MHNMKKTSINFNSQQKGFTLVEIMVAVTIGLVMTAGILQISQANKESNRLQRNMGYVQENIRTAMDILAQDIRLAGQFIDDNPAGRILTSPAPFNNVSAATTTADGAPITADGGGNENDQITVTYEVTATTPTNCLGQIPPVATVAPIAGNQFVVNHYFISNQRLMCRGNGGNAQPLVDGVESLQILYGESTGGDPRSANVYVPAHQITNVMNVVSVRIGMRFVSREPVRTTADPNSYALLDAAAFTPSAVNPDRRLRREITSTISLRNAGI